MSRLISDYAVIGDTHTTALVASDGSIDWLCWPRHDSPALFTKLLDDDSGGFAAVIVDHGRAAGRRYAGETNVLQTDLRSESGHGRLDDFMPLFPPSPIPDEGPDGTSQSRLVRLLTCESGVMTVRFQVKITPDYGRGGVTTSADGTSATLRAGEMELSFASSHPIAVLDDRLEVAATLSRNEAAFIALTVVGAEEVEPIDSIAEAIDALEKTRRYWEAWAQKSSYDGPYRPQVIRSALVLKLLTYSPTGGIVAAATTSLPEAVPGDRNFDYRYSWVRDASFTITAFCNLGYVREASEYLRFLRDVDQSNGRDLELVYGIDGAVPHEETLPSLPGWNNVGPVRIGNAALCQAQHDIYGEYLLAVHTYLSTVDYRPPPSVSEGLVQLITNLADQAERRRQDPDRGIWELRSGDDHLQHTKALIWVALDRAVKMAARMPGFDPGGVERWRDAATAVREEYERRCWNDTVGAYTQSYESAVLDASVLRTVLFGALDPTAARTRATIEAVETHLASGDLIYRYKVEDGLRGTEATFTACAFWRAGALALAGETKRARAIFERLLLRGNDVGLYAEEIDAATGEQRGNYPQAFTHMAIINLVIRLDAAISQYGLV